jgi:hypothetical protein
MSHAIINPIILLKYVDKTDRFGIHLQIIRHHGSVGNSFLTAGLKRETKTDAAAQERVFSCQDSANHTCED